MINVFSVHQPKILVCAGMLKCSLDHFFVIGLALGLTIIGLGLGLGLMKYWSRSHCGLVS